jgi:hypothetical protein
MFGIGRRRASQPWDPERPLVQWSRRAAWTIRDSFNGTLILGQTGSGKTSGSGRTIAEAMLRAGYGALILTAKPGERTLWENYCRNTGRSADLLVFGPEEPWRFNFLDFEMRRGGPGAGLIENIAQLLQLLPEMVKRERDEGGGHPDDPYWETTKVQLSRNLVDLLGMAVQEVSVPNLYKLLVSAPLSLQEANSQQWQQCSFLYQCLVEADRLVEDEEKRKDLAIVSKFFLEEYAGLSDKTRSIIKSTFTSSIDVLNRGVLRKLFCGGTNVTPQAIEDGKIILVDFPIKEFGSIGGFANGLWKYAFQKSIERRSTVDRPRPVFLWADEAQFFVTSHDMDFHSTCRSSSVATVLLSQNLSNFYAVLGGDKTGEAQVDSIFGNCGLKIFHANGDPKTNHWASELIGKTRQFLVHANQSYEANDMYGDLLGLGQIGQTSSGVNEVLEYEVQPSAFTRLRTGGPRNRFEVDAIVVTTDGVFADNGRTWRLATFKQR